MFILSQILSFIESKGTGNIQRYYIGSKLRFGGSFTIPLIKVTIPIPAPPNNRLRVYNSFTELGAQLNADGSVNYIDTVQNSSLGNIILEPSIIKELMVSDNPYNYLAKNSFNCSVIFRGRRQYFRYSPKQMYMTVDFASDVKTYQKMLEASEYEKACQAFVESAQRNAKALAVVAQDFDKMNAADKQKVRLAIIKHKNVLTEFKDKLAPGFYFQTVELRADRFEAVGVIPVIVWAIIIIVSGAVVAGVTISYINKRAEVKKQQQQLDANYNSIQELRQAQIDRNNGVINDEQYTDQKVLITKNVDTGNKNLTTAADAAAKEATSGGILGEVKQILLIGAIMYGAKLIFTGNGK